MAGHGGLRASQRGRVAAAIGALACLLVLALPGWGEAGGIWLDAVQAEAVSPNGRWVLMQAGTPLLPADDGSTRGYYRYSVDRRRLDYVATGPRGAREYDAARISDAGRILLETDAALDPADGDSWLDFYLFDGAGGATLMTPFDAGEDEDFYSPQAYVGSSADLETLYFGTLRKAVPTDNDDESDLYVSHLGDLERITEPRVADDHGGGWTGYNTTGASADGGAIFFDSLRRLVPADNDERYDLYLLDDGELTLASPGPQTQDGFDVRAGDPASRRLLFTTYSSLLPSDLGGYDLYLWDSDHLELLTPGDLGGDYIEDGAVVGANEAYFSTTARLVARDQDDQMDTYRYAGGALSLAVRDGQGRIGGDNFFVVGRASDGRPVGYSTSSLDPRDDDQGWDVYIGGRQRSTLVSDDSEGRNSAAYASLEGVSANGSSVVFGTAGAMVPGDTDCPSHAPPGCYDLYVSGVDGETRILTDTVGTAANADQRTYGILGEPRNVLQGISRDGSRIVFETGQSLVPEDTPDGVADVYLWDDGCVRLISAPGQSRCWPTGTEADTTPPETTLEDDFVTVGRRVTFRFGSNEAGSSFRCRLDGATYRACASPRTVTNLGDGPHTFAVAAVDAAGNVDATPAKDRFTVGVTTALADPAAARDGFRVKRR